MTTEKDQSHDLTMEVQDEPRMFRCVCSCGQYASRWETTNACMGGGHRHVAALRRRRVTSPVKSFEEMTNEEFEACPDSPEKQDYIVSLYQAANQAHTRPGPGDALGLGGTQSVSD